MVDRLLDTLEAAKLLATAEQTLRIWRVQGKGPKFVKLGRAVRYRESDIAAFIKSLETT
ncbi:hypothetical protein GMST_43270 [Geomonas silvestris]|uniref:Helix-turn-helix domain-containing protein n=1 Tax=Geomonas silvestris TaxID=2740184 RepID=A0A6V8MQ09_9BACT|nr:MULTISPECIES: helix-turn-helix domain-containing protein [Geomonas]GFO62002.1 hypothetical protein GMST_43270 [Geomonas silvestris]